MLTFIGMRNQWRAGFNGPTGLDFSSWREFAEHAGAQPDQMSGIFGDLLILESEALATMHEAS